MKRMHVSLTVADLDRSVNFYSELFAVEPSVRKPDYAKWMLEDPRLNFSITTHGDRPGVNHLGVQVDSEDELAEVYARLRSTDEPVSEQGATTCCYAHSEKSWIADPDGVAWEAFLTKGQSADYGHDRELAVADEATKPSARAGARCC